MKRTSILFLIFCTLFAQNGCMANAPKFAQNMSADFGEAEMCEAPAPAPMRNAYKTKANYASAAAGIASPADFQVSTNRQMIFTANLNLAVPEIPEAIKQAQSITEKLGGYTRSLQNRSGNFRIPVAKANEAMEQFSALGNIMQKNIEAQDVTEQATELQIRLDNLETLRKRLQKLAENGQNVKDLLDVERELARVTGEIELYKGRLNLLKNKIEFVTFQLNFEQIKTAAPVQTREFTIDWVAMLGTEITADLQSEYVPEEKNPAFDTKLPENFVLMQNSRGLTYAANAQGSIIKLSVLPDRPGGTTEFWTELLRKQFENPLNRYTGTRVENVTTSEGFPAIAVTAERIIGKENYGYSLLLIRFDEAIYLYEFWGKKADFDRILPEVAKLAREKTDLSIWH